MRTPWVRTVAGMASLLIAVALLVVALPAITGVGWRDIGHTLGRLSSATLLWLGVLWLAGLWTYTLVLTSSLPRLRHVQALVLNFAGSAISNVVPFGGAAGAAATFVMAGSWGFPKSAVAVSLLVSGAWNALSRLALPAVGLTVLLASGYVPDRSLTVAVAVATALLVAILAFITAALTLDRTNRWATRIAFSLYPRAVWPRRLVEGLNRLRETTRDVITHGWIRLTIGMVGYLGLQYLLFWACLAATSAHAGTGAMIAAFALSRLLASAAVTPGGIGVTESGSAALLVALGAAPAPTAAAMILFGFFTNAVEIPVGGLAWVTWAAAKRWRGKRYVPPPGSDTRGDDPAAAA